MTGGRRVARPADRYDARVARLGAPHAPTMAFSRRGMPPAIARETSANADGCAGEGVGCAMDTIMVTAGVVGVFVGATDGRRVLVPPRLVRAIEVQASTREW